MELEWLGNSSFRIDIGDTTFVTDPAYDEDPNAPVAAGDVEYADFVLVTHGHPDHASDAVAVARASNAPIVAVAELAVELEQRGDGVETIVRNPSSPRDLGTGVEVGLVEMDHSSSVGLSEGEARYAGVPCGFVLDDGEQVVFHAGDTALCANLKVVGEVYDPDVAMLPISGGFVTDEQEAGIAADWVDTDAAIPMHYDSSEAIPDADPRAFAASVEERAPGTETIVLDQGETVEL